MYTQKAARLNWAGREIQVGDRKVKVQEDLTDSTYANPTPPHENRCYTWPCE